MNSSHDKNDYEMIQNSFDWVVPEKFNFARDVIDKLATDDPEKLAMLWVDDKQNQKSRTFYHFSKASKKFANVLTSLGIKREEVVIVILGRDVEWWEIFTACIRTGSLVSPGTTQLTSKDIKYRINTAKATCIITDTNNAAKVEEITDECPSLKAKIILGEPRQESTKHSWTRYSEAMEKASEEFDTANTKADDPSIVYFTSGTTGPPKMCLHTHSSYGIGHNVTGKFWLDLKLNDLHWNISDTGWAKAAYSSYFGPWSCGAAIFVHFSDRFDPLKTLELLQHYPITTMCGAPTIYRMLVLQDFSKFNFPSLRHCVGAGEPLNPEIIHVWKKATGIIIRDGYGQTETILLCGNFLSIEPRFGSMGKPSPGIDLQVIDNEGKIAPVDTEGDIAVRVRPKRPVGLFKEYWKEPKKTNSKFVGDWYLTGDRATRDKEGYFWFVGRSDDVILTSGYRIGPFEVESALIEHPAVVESAVVSSPDEMRGEIVKAFVILAPGYTPNTALAKELQDHVKKVTAPYKYPRIIEFVASLPKTVSGKIRRVELRSNEWGKIRSKSENT